MAEMYVLPRIGSRKDWNLHEFKLLQGRNITVVHLVQ